MQMTTTDNAPLIRFCRTITRRVSLTLCTLGDHAMDRAPLGMQPLSDMRTHEEDMHRRTFLGIPSIFD